MNKLVRIALILGAGGAPGFGGLRLARADCRELMAVTTLRDLQPIAAADPAQAILGDLRAHARLLVDTTPENAQKGYAVFLARGREIPVAMREVGRAREETFRTVGEGTGRELDRDAFDDYYLQLVCWDKKHATVSGAYRLGQADQILTEKGIDGLYVNTLFEFDALIQDDLARGTLEMGRSFVRPAYQRGLTFAMLWAGIGRFLSENPRYYRLIGPVSISGEFSGQARLLMSEYLMGRYRAERADSVRPRTPPRFPSVKDPAEVAGRARRLTSLEELQREVRMAEGDDAVKLPPLIKIYQDLDTRFLSFNWDADFNALDGLIVTDLRTLPFATHSKYMGDEAARTYRAAHGLESPPRN